MVCDGHVRTWWLIQINKETFFLFCFAQRNRIDFQFANKEIPFKFHLPLHGEVCAYFYSNNNWKNQNKKHLNKTRILAKSTFRFVDMCLLFIESFKWNNETRKTSLSVESQNEKRQGKDGAGYVSLMHWNRNITACDNGDGGNGELKLISVNIRLAQV